MRSRRPGPSRDKDRRTDKRGEVGKRENFVAHQLGSFVRSRCQPGRLRNAVGGTGVDDDQLFGFDGFICAIPLDGYFAVGKLFDDDRFSAAHRQRARLNIHKLRQNLSGVPAAGARHSFGNGNANLISEVFARLADVSQ